MSAACSSRRTYTHKPGLSGRVAVACIDLSKDSVVKAVQVGHRPVIAGAEPFAIVLPEIASDVGVPVFFAILDVGWAMVVKVLASAFDSIVEALPLCLAKLSRRRIPVMIVIMIVLRASRWRGCGNCFARSETRERKSQK